MKLQTQNIYFLSDSHFHHSNVISYDKREFTSVEEMNETMILKWNKTIKPTDLVFYLGDFSFSRDKQKTKELAHRLNGVIHYIMGNHDDYDTIKSLDRFESISYYKEILVLDEDTEKRYQKIVMSHYPVAEWNQAHRGSFHLFGHTHHSFFKSEHGKLMKKYKMMDVGVNGYDYIPVSYQQVKDYMKNKIDIGHH